MPSLCRCTTSSAPLSHCGLSSQPTARFPGSFGSSYLYFVVPKVILFRTEHSKRTLVPKVPYISAPGGSDGNVHRTGGEIVLGGSANNAGTLLAIARVEIPYVPTVKGPVRGQLFWLAWPQLVLIGIYATTAITTIYIRLRIAPEASLPLSAEAVWGMLTFATLPVLSAFGALYAAWQARTPAPGAAWDEIDVEQ